MIAAISDMKEKGGSEHGGGAQKAPWGRGC